MAQSKISGSTKLEGDDFDMRKDERGRLPEKLKHDESQVLRNKHDGQKQEKLAKYFNVD